MRTVPLYLLLFVGVLWVVGCGQNRSNSDTTDADTSTSPSAPVESKARAGTDSTDGLRVLVLGNSIAAGLGVATDASFPARLQQKVDSLGWNVAVQNAGVSGETSAGGLRRIGWLLNEEVDVLVLELGGNDGLRGVPTNATQENLTGIIDTTLATYPDAQVLLTAMRIPTNLGSEYVEAFRDVYPAVANEYSQVTLVEFDRRLQAGADSLMQNDGIHPTAPGHRLIATDIWRELRPLLEAMQTEEPT